MKVLIITMAFYPELSPRSFRATELAKGFANMGHDVTVLKPESEQDISILLDKYPIKIENYGPLEWKTWGASKIKWIGDKKRKLGRLLFFLIDHPNIQILWKLKPALKKNNDFDLIISIAVPHSIHWAIALVRSKKHPIGIIWVADCGDPYMGNVLESIKPMPYFAFLEKLFCRKADFISVPTKSSINGYYPEFHHKIKVIPQGFDFEGINTSNTKPNYNQPNFAYAGGISTSGIRSLHKVIHCLLNTKLDFKFHVFSSNGKAVLADFIENYPEKIVVHNPIERNKLIYELSKMDFLVNLDNGTPLNTPSKIIDYSLAKRPILNISALEPDVNLLLEFLTANYTNALQVEDVNRYNIKNTIKSFTELVP